MQLRQVHLTGKKRAGIHRPQRWVPAKRCWYSLYTGAWEWRISYAPGKGRWASGVRVRGTQFAFENMPFLMEDLVKKRTVKSGATSAGGPSHLAAVESLTFDKFPRIIEHLVTTRYADGEPRKPGLLMVNVLGATWQVRLTEPDINARLTCLAEALDDALALAELHLGADDAPWEVDSYAASRKGKK